MRFELKSIGVWSFLKVAFFVNAFLGFLTGLMYVPFIVMISNGFLSQFGMSDMSDSDIGSEGIMFIMFFIPFMFTIFGAVFYTLFGLIFVIIYNIFSKFIGGIELNLDSIKGGTMQIVPTNKQTQEVGSSQTVISKLTPPPPPPPMTKAQPPIESEPAVKIEDVKKDNHDIDDKQDNKQV